MTLIEALRYALGQYNARLEAVETKETSPNADYMMKSAFVDLPTGPTVALTAGRVRYCTNCRKTGEGVGAGTGTPVYHDLAQWRRISDDVIASA